MISGPALLPLIYDRGQGAISLQLTSQYARWGQGRTSQALILGPLFNKVSFTVLSRQGTAPALPSTEVGEELGELSHLLSVARSGGKGIFPLPMPSRVRQGGQDQFSSTLADKVSSVRLSRDLLSAVLQLVGDRTSSSSCCSQGGVDQIPCTPIFLVFSGNRRHRYQHRSQLQQGYQRRHGPWGQQLRPGYHHDPRQQAGHQPCPGWKSLDLCVDLCLPFNLTGTGEVPVSYSDLRTTTLYKP